MRVRLTLFVLAVLLAGCGGPEGRWTVSRIDGQPFGPSSRQLLVEFAHGRLAAATGCNRVGAHYIAFGGRLWWTHPVESTAMACFPDRIMALDDALTERLAWTRRYELVGPSLILRTGDGRSLTLVPAPPAREMLEGDWVVSSITPSPGWQGKGRPWVTFHNGAVTDSAGCVGRYRHDGDRFQIDYRPTVACNAAIARTTPPQRGRFDQLSGPQDALFARIRVVGVHFPNTWVGCSYPTLIGADGMRVSLSPATGADFVPPSGWTLDGAWRQLGPRTGTVVFDHGVVTEAGACRGRYKRFIDALTFAFPPACQRRVRARGETRPGLTPLSSVSGNLMVDMQDYRHMSLDRDRKPAFDFQRVVGPEMTHPHQSCA